MRKTLEAIHGVLDKLMVLIHWVAGLLTACMSSRISWTAAASWCPTPSISG